MPLFRSGPNDTPQAEHRETRTPGPGRRHRSAGSRGSRIRSIPQPDRCYHAYAFPCDSNGLCSLRPNRLLSAIRGTRQMTSPAAGRNA